MFRLPVLTLLIVGLLAVSADGQAQSANPATAAAPSPAASAGAEPAQAAPVGRIKRLSGKVFIERDGTNLPARAGMALQRNDRVVTGKPGGVGIVLADDTSLSAGPDTRIELADVQFDSTTHKGRLFVRLLKGAMHVVTGLIARESPKDVRIETPTAVMGVRGTEFIVEVEGETR